MYRPSAAAAACRHFQAVRTGYICARRIAQRSTHIAFVLLDSIAAFFARPNFPGALPALSRLAWGRWHCHYKALVWETVWHLCLFSKQNRYAPQSPRSSAQHCAASNETAGSLQLFLIKCQTSNQLVLPKLDGGGRCSSIGDGGKSLYHQGLQLCTARRNLHLDRAPHERLGCRSPGKTNAKGLMQCCRDFMHFCITNLVCFAYKSCKSLHRLVRLVRLVSKAHQICNAKVVDLAVLDIAHT